MNNSWSIVYTYNKDCPPIHSGRLFQSNINAQIILADTNHYYPKKIAWQISDKFIRDWFKTNIHTIKYNNVAILEWDVMVNTTLPDIMLDKDIMVGGIAKYPENQNWHWFKHASKLPEYLLPYKIGCCPTGFILCSINAIKSWLDPKFDDLYDKILMSELRIFTIFNYLGFNLIKYPSETILYKSNNYNLNEKGIFHPVKHKHI